VACDFACIDSAPLGRYYLLFFIDITSREVFYAGITTNPTGPWTTQQARNLFVIHADRLADTAALVRDRGSQFTSSFDEIFRTEHMKVLKTPVRMPLANSFAERWIATLRRELLDRTIIWHRHQLEPIVIDYIDHYNTHRPHRSLNQRPPRNITQQEPRAMLHHRYESSNRPAATDSSTNTKTPHNQPRPNIGHPQADRAFRPNIKIGD
jgi:putative transposase